MADAVITSESDPTDSPVICQDAVAVPICNKPILYVGEATKKWPFCELNVTVTLDKAEYLPVLTLFSTTTVTVTVWPTPKVAGN